MDEKIVRRITLITNPNKCNLNCPLCFLHQVKGKFWGEMPFDLAKKIIEKYNSKKDNLGRRILKELIPSTMGEPLLYSDFFKLLRLCENLNLPLNITTNGSFPFGFDTEENLKLLLRNCRDIKISTLGAESGGLSNTIWRNNFEKLMNVKLKIKNEIKTTITLQITLHQKNLNIIEDYLDFIETLKVDRVKINPVIFLKNVSSNLKNEYELTAKDLDRVREITKNRPFIVEGSLFRNFSKSCCTVSGLECPSKHKAHPLCPFQNELWVWPDGSEDRCPAPEKRWVSF